MKRDRERRPVRPFSPARIIAASFLGVILVGTVLLMLPISSKNGEMLHPLTALFTATSATCVTGLTLVDPYTQFTFFGQLVLLLMIEIGGIGLLTLTNFFMFFLHKKLGLRTLRLAQENTNAWSLNNIRSLLHIIVVTTLVIESLGAILLSIRFVPKYGVHGVWVSIFTSVSAYCNAGFDILGNETPFGSLIHYNGDVIVLYTVMALIFLGGIGFMVFQDLLSWRRHRHLMLHTKAMLIMSATLIAVGFLIFFIVEYENPKTLGPLPLFEKINAALFQSVSARTAGFASLDLSQMQDFSKVVMIFLMIIGAGSGSCAGGIKVTTFLVLVMTVVSVIRGRDDTVVLGRRVAKQTVYKAMTIAALGLSAVVMNAAVNLISLPGLSGVDGIFEAASAFGTVGMTAGVTLQVGLAAKIATILTMVNGRIGPISFALALTIRGEGSGGEVLPEGRIMVG